MATLIRVDRNGTKYFEGDVPCDRCDGKGIYYIGICNGQLVPSWVDQGVCFKCGGSGVQHSTWKEYTPEYEAKLEARRKARREKYEAEHAEEIAKAQAEREAKEAERKRQEEISRLAQEEEERKELERKAKSQYIGQIGDKIDTVATFIKTAWFDVPSFGGFGTETMYIHTFRIGDDTVVWKTSTNTLGKFDENDEWIRFEEGKQVHLKGTIKAHSEYKDEKQTILTRCKVKEVQ